jgi:hypothetical protein
MPKKKESTYQARLRIKAPLPGLGLKTLLRLIFYFFTAWLADRAFVFFIFLVIRPIGNTLLNMA